MRLCSHSYRRIGYCKTETECAVVLPNCRINTDKMDNISLFCQNDVSANQNICTSTDYDISDSQLTTDIGKRMILLRLSKNLTAKVVAEKIGICTSTISRYENNQITPEHTDLELLKKYALCCEADKYYLFDEYLIFRNFKDNILNEYIIQKNITKTQLSKELSVSKTLVLSWFNKENRSPSREMWQTAFKDFTLSWLEKNFDSFKN